MLNNVKFLHFVFFFFFLFKDGRDLSMRRECYVTARVNNYSSLPKTEGVAVMWDFQF